MDTGVTNFLKTFIVNTVFAHPPPECPPPRTVPCPNRSKNSDSENPPGDGSNVTGSTKPSPPVNKQCRKSPRVDGTSTRGEGESTRGDGTSTGRDCASTRGDGTSPRGDGASTRGRGASRRGDCASTRGDGVSTRGDGASTRGDGASMRCDGATTGAGNSGKTGSGNLGKAGSGNLGKSGAGNMGKAGAASIGKTGAGDLGKAGAGVTGSRTSKSEESELAEQNEHGLPVGATNPGLLRHIHNAARYRLPLCFEGASVSVKQKSENNWVVGHSMMFSSVSPGGYKLLLSYLDKEKPTGLPYFVMESAPGGQMSCEVRVGPTYGTRATVMAQVADAEFRSFESIIDFFFNSATASVIAVNREFIAMHFLQAITDNLSVGCEAVARGQFAEMSSVSGAARWASDDVAVSGTIGNRGLDLCFARAVRPFLTVAALLEVGFAIRRAVATLAYEWRADDWTFRGSADSDGLVGATLQRVLGGQRAHLACALSALYNHPNDKFRLGFGVTASII